MERRQQRMNGMMDNRRLVSVVIPLYNGGKYIESTLASVLSQSYDAFEVIVIDDGSTDDGPVKVKAIADGAQGHVHLLHHPDHGNHGIAASRNLGIRSARGAWIAFIDQDDQWLPHKLERQMESILKWPDAGFVYGKSSFIDRDGREIPLGGIHTSGGRGIAGEPRNVFRELIKENCIPTCTTVVRKDCIEFVGLLDDGPRYEYEDWIVFSKMAFFYDAVFVPEIVSRYRIHENNYSAFLFQTGKLYHAEEHYTITLFSYLLSQKNTSEQKVRELLHRRIRFFFLRARSWGVSSGAIRQHAENFLMAFPEDRKAIQAAARNALLLHPWLASCLRRLRRSLVRI